MRRASAIAACAACLLTPRQGVRTQSLQQPGGVAQVHPSGSPGFRLAPTSHPPLPVQPSQFWLVPDRLAAVRAPTPGRGNERAQGEAVLEGFARGVALFQSGEYDRALPLLSAPGLGATPLADYARYYTGYAQLRLEHHDQAASVLDAVDDRHPAGYLAQGVALRRAELALARRNPAKAFSILEQLSRDKTLDTEDLFLRAARAAEEAGSSDRALVLYRRVYFESPLSAEADVAKGEIDRLDGPALLTPDRFALELSRAERLFGAHRYPDARDAFARLLKAAGGDEKEQVALRVAESDYYLRRYGAARDVLRPYQSNAKREAEARFFYLSTLRALGDETSYVTRSRDLVAAFPRDSWAEEALNNLASYYITRDDDEAADLVLRELLERFPGSRYGERAAWKIGWYAFRNGRPEDTARYFDQAAATLTRADLRPAWLYWSGRAHEQFGAVADATARYRLAATDYLNSYYGRLAMVKLGARGGLPVRSIATEPSTAPLGPTDRVVRQLIAVGLFDDAVREVQYAQRVWGDSPALQATFAWIRHEQGLQLTARERFDYLRGAINTMKRAYPQYLASGGEDLPPQVLAIVFPIDYWTIIKKYAEERGLDPYLLAALINQESTFTADIKSSANAVGLMQLLPSTGRQYAKRLRIPYGSRTLTQAETNVRLGTAYFKDLVDRFGGDYFAIASYNAGEGRVARWIAEKPGLPQDEFIDDIPFPETQNYVKKILGMAVDYRRLYGGGLLNPDDGGHAVAAEVAPPRSPGAPAVKKAAVKKAAVKKAKPTKAPSKPRPRLRAR